jgi:hypothetical protein
MIFSDPKDKGNIERIDDIRSNMMAGLETIQQNQFQNYFEG